MKTIIELILEMVGYLILIFAVVWAFVRFTGYGEYYDKMLRGDEDSETTIVENEKKKEESKDNTNNNMIHHVSLKKTNSKCKQSF
jgi:hypothetical protein